MIGRLHCPLFIALLVLGSRGLYAQCNASAGPDLSICDGDGSNSNYTYLDGTGSEVPEGEIEYDWTVLTVVGDGGWRETLVITSGESDEPDPRFKYPYELASDTEFLIELRVFNDLGTCEDRDTLKVYIKSNMCPRADAGNDLTMVNGCDSQVTLDGSDSEDPQDEEITFSWSSLDGYDMNFLVSDAEEALFNFPYTESDQVFTFILIVDDGVNSSNDTVKVLYIDNDAPVAIAGDDFTTCEFEFPLSAAQSYDVNWNELSYSWASLDGLSIVDGNTKIPTVVSPTNLETDTGYNFELQVNDGFCTSHDTVRVVIESNLCPVADAGETVRIPKFSSSPAMLNAENSFDPDGESLIYEWTTPSGELFSNPILSVSDLNPNDRFSSYHYILKVMDIENAISRDTVEVIFGNFSPPISPSIYAVASHGQVLVSWDAASEASYDSLTGYADFEGYKLYRSTDGGNTWGSESDKLYDFNGQFVGWLPLAQFDYDFEEDVSHCIYDHEGNCSEDLTRQTSISGLDPYLPRFNLGANTGLSYSYIDSNVVDGVEYIYPVTAYDMGLPKFDVEFSQVDTANVFTADTIWHISNPGNFYGPDSVEIYDAEGSLLRKDPNPYRGFPFLESKKGDSTDNNFIKVIPGYTALDISFPQADDIEALFTSGQSNIGTGDREYFIVDRDEIVRGENIMYEIQATQSTIAVDGMACEDPYIYAYVVEDSSGVPKYPVPVYDQGLSFYEKDSLSKLPGAIYENGSYIIPKYELINPLGRWSDQFRGIRFKMENKIPLSVSAAPIAEIDTLLWTWASPDSSEMDSTKVFELLYSVITEMRYTDVASYLKRLNFDYKIEFFSVPDSGTVIPINQNEMYVPFKITNTYTDKEVRFECNDFGSSDTGPFDIENGALNLVWTPGENIRLKFDSLQIGGIWSESYNYDLDIFLPVRSSEQTKKSYDEIKDYNQGDTVFFQGLLWHATLPAEAGVKPLSVFRDLQDDNIRNNPWRPAYPWSGGEQLLIKPHKLFVDGDRWFSNMAILGENVGIADTLCLDSIKVVPNPYRASSPYNETSNMSRIRFTHLPTRCNISIYTVAGEHITTIKHEDQFDGNEWWNLRTGNDQNGDEIAPGLYLYVIEFEEEKDYCVDTYDSEGDVEGSLRNDYYSNDQYDNKRLIKKTKYHIGKFAVIR